MQKGFLACHPSSYDCEWNQYNEWNEKAKGKILDVFILGEGQIEHKEMMLVETADKVKIYVDKWPTNHFGKLFGVFSNKQLAQKYLDNPAPKFTLDGRLIE